MKVFRLSTPLRHAFASAPILIFPTGQIPNPRIAGDDYALEAWERMTNGGVQLSPVDRSLLNWYTNTRWQPYPLTFHVAH